MERNSLQRVLTLSLKFQKDVTVSDVFQLLKKNGIETKDLVAVQSLPGRLYDVSFKSADIKNKYVKILSEEPEVVTNNYVENVKIITVLHVPYELDDNVVRFVLGRYGKVVGGTFLTYKDQSGVFNGIRQYKVVLEKDVPSSLKLAGRQCWVRYRGQPITCLKCDGTGHLAAACNQVKCFKCFKLGHVASQCVEKVVCTTCGKEGHGYRKCPVSFANRLINPTSEWVSGGARVQGNDEKEGEDVPPTTAEEGTGSEKGEGAEVDAPKLPETADKDDLSEGKGDVPQTSTEADEVLSEQSDEGVGQERAGNARSASKAEGETVNPEETQMEWSQGDWSESVGEMGQRLDSDPSEGMFTGMGEVDGEGAGRQRDRNSLKRGRSSQRSRSQSRPAKREGVVDSAREIVLRSKIFTETGNWITCGRDGCSEEFNSSDLHNIHQVRDHQVTSLERIDCPVRGCTVRCNDHQEWANHLANRHPNYVLSHNTEFFDLYFIDETC
ncbi:uncharacterized protein [Apostichopus japonicus]|uniref:uncharacterized protein n=1 Tax=Stichopus japonicus TaxID=307972 RepID=UPI003AB40806